MIVNKIKGLLRIHEVTAYKVARDLLLPTQTIYSLANNPKRLPRKPILELLLVYFDASVNEILQIVEDKSQLIDYCLNSYE